ncbi:MAG: heme ABC exporter ATP-binding protein CcmA [Magnetococcales bacterium]|nr:heme ABC exporter ATP-binding protein CcmA [Magnetococcales bacterium]MBF0174125.1 heme ABC exporter ATP-binding protein CcmA [Magnetococcales bacterium]MBF0632008.1 heme ABC exporter ATP-binding protein CcmA [Magnetococcales bacterium]
MDMTQLEAVNIGHRFGQRMVLRDVNLSVTAGECAVLYGANGSGKSTLLSLLATRLRMQQGQCRLDQINLHTDGETARRHLIFVGHHSHLYGHLTPLENLLFFRDLHQCTSGRESLIAAITQAGLAPFIQQPIRWFSAGMKKRLALARILIAKPKLLLLDEPYSALDHEGIRWLNGIIETFQTQGGIIVMASHDPERVAALRHTPWHLNGGVLRPMGSPHPC